MSARVTYTLRTSVGVEFKIIGTGITYEMAKEEADAKVALSSGEIISATKSQDIEPEEWEKPIESGGNPGRAVITLARNYGESRKTLEFTHASGQISDKVRQDGSINVRHPLVLRLAEAHRDSDGKGGYRAVSGEFMGRLQRKRKFK